LRWQRVVVVRSTSPYGDGDTVELGAAGTVVRLRMRDGGAFVALDARLSGEVERAHMFPVDDHAGRGTHVLAYPEDCEAAG